MSNPQQQYQNDHVTATVERLPGCHVRIDVSVSPAAVKAAQLKAIKIVSKEVSIPGFRKGKAPEAIILQNFSKYVDKEWRETVIHSALAEVLQLAKIYPFTKESVKAHLNSCTMDGASLLLEFESSPEVPSINPKELHIAPIARRNVRENDVLDAIENFRLHYAAWEPVTDRPASENDYVVLDIDILEEPAQNVCQDTRFEIVPGKMGTWMRKLIIGLAPGQSAEGMSEKEETDDRCEKCESGDSTHHHEHAPFQPKMCRITLKAIQKCTIPELDEPFLKKFGLASTDDLRERIEKELNRHADEDYTHQCRAAMQQALLEKYPFGIPNSLITKQQAEQRANIIKDLKEQGVAATDLASQTEQISREVSSRLERDYKTFFLVQKFSDEFNISIKQEDITEEFTRQLMLQQSGKGMLDLSMDPKEMQSRLVVYVTINKVLDFLLEKMHEEKT